jgi:adenylosuccinate lyase
MPHKKPIAATLLFGIASVVMYTLLFMNSDLFVDWAERTIKGEKSLFLIPVVVAFVFSYFHGTFTGHFWETLGLRAAKTIAHAPAKSGAKK